MTELRDGAVLQGGLRYHERKANPGDSVRYIPFPVEGQIFNAVAPEDDLNFDQETYLCDIHVTEMGIDLFQVPWTLGKAGPDNYVHVGPVAASKNLFDPASGELPKPFNKQLLQPKVSNGDTVIVVFIMGDVHRPKIIAMLPHNQSGPNGLCPDPRPTADDGDCAKVRFGGMSMLLDKAGNLSIYNTQSLDEVMTGQVIPTPKTISIDLTDSLGEHTVTTFDGATGNLTYEGSNGTQMTVDNENDEIDLLCSFGDELSISAADGIQASTPANGGTSLSMKNGQVDITAGQGVSITAMGGPFDITVEGDYDITSSGGAVNIEAQGGDVSVQSDTGDVSVQASAGAVKLVGSGGAELNLTGAQVALGSPAAEVVDLLSQTVDMLTNIATDLSTTTAAGFGAPISSVAAFAALIPQIAAIKALVTSIKGSL